MSSVFLCVLLFCVVHVRRVVSGSDFFVAACDVGLCRAVVLAKPPITKCRVPLVVTVGATGVREVK